MSSNTNTNSGTIFNVAEPQGVDAVRLETTAAGAQANAPTSREAREIENNAELSKEAAQQAASVAKTLGPELTGERATAVDQFGRNASETTNAAVNEGKQDVEAAKAAGAGYIEQAKSIASSAISTAQNYLPTAVGGKPADPNAITTTQSTTTTTTNPSSVLSTTAAYVTSAAQTAKEVAQPHLETAKEFVQPHIETAKGYAQNVLGTAGTQGVSANPPASSTGIPATSAPLESGPHTTKTPYPATATNTGVNIAQNEGAKTVN